MRYLVWGTGTAAKKFLNDYWRELFVKNTVEAFIDSDPKKCGKKCMYRNIISPGMINECSFDRILICSSYENEIRKQLSEMEMDSRFIINRDDFLYEFYEQYTREGIFQKEILIIGDENRYKQMENVYHSLFHVAGFVDIRSLNEIENYEYDCIVLMNLMDMIFMDRKLGKIQLEKNLVDMLVKKYAVLEENIYTDSEKSILKDYRKDEMVSWGDENPDKVFLVIRAGGVGGIGACILFIAGHIAYAKKKGYIPVVDMMTFKNQYLDDNEVGRVNAWEKFFEQVGGWSLRDIKNSKNIILPSGYRKREINSDLSFLQVQPKLKENMLLYNKKLFGDGCGGRILGVLFRGTDYVNRRPYGHFIQPDLEMMISKVKEKVLEWKYDKVYLCTEVEEAVVRFREEFGGKLYFYPQKRFPGKINTYLAEIKWDRKGDAYLRGADYLIALYALAKCDSLVAGRCGGSEIALKLNKNAYRHVYLFSLGQYGIDDVCYE